MTELPLVFIAGFVASLVDGSLGMGFGPISASILSGVGLGPASVSATVNLAKVATGFTAAISHWRFDNIDRRLVVRLALPGMMGALLGVTVLANVEAADIKPVLAVLLLVVGVRILWRFSRALPRGAAAGGGNEADGGDGSDRANGADGASGGPGGGGDAGERGGRPLDLPARGPTLVAATAGGITNGLVGAWGPVVTPFLLARGLAPRYAVGSVNTAEMAVAMVASGSLVASVGSGAVDPRVVAAMLIGGVAAAPVAAWSVRFLPARGLGVAVGALLVLTNLRELSNSMGLGSGRWLVYAVATAVVASAAFRPRWAGRTRTPADPGSPSGVASSPSAAMDAGGDAPLARVHAVCASPTHSMGKPTRERVQMVSGHGIDGDVHAGAIGPEGSGEGPNRRQVHLMPLELFDDLAAQGLVVGPGQMGENVTVAGVDLVSLPLGTRLSLGSDAVVELTGLRTPCRQLDAVAPGLAAALFPAGPDGVRRRRAGVMAVVVRSGEVRAGDGVTVEVPPIPHLSLPPV
ncbi:MAG: TSUP family transporter [Acidimicrobiales bacterium]